MTVSAQEALTFPTSRASAGLVWLCRVWRELVANPLTLAGIMVIVGLLVMAVAAPGMTSYDPLAQDLSQRLLPPSTAHWCGTDELGRDIFARIVYGARITLRIVLLVLAVVAPAGLLVGCAAGYLGGWVDAVLMRITDIFLAFPKLILALALVAALGPGLDNAVIAIALTAWPPFARIVRARTVSLREAEFVQAARLMGASRARIIVSHIVPLCLPPLVVRMTLEMSGIILTAAGLGFLGLGAQPPMPEWGAMISTGRAFLLDQWWVATMPGIAIFVVSLGFNLFGDGLRDVLDPKTETRV
ncbi:MAG: ABC transporter permease [Alphaproteobacteria bacterium]|jgi:peptide/nickel transport system permease protein|nr:ABC transporter permease [Alphaproteobacteria bacterium]MDP6661207.1 ABC transporter permease [Alphaproteobacteria bacterium]MDP6781299.1 ABC transporter permease [Alphaproteobacteria bacterium]MDP7044888.1 ABC transporter permease [Alphaproteobacteria bacterium]HAQ32979.1 D,D-dipeptide ABC transporter permease [Rhodospirillaceae bacterium]|tara:strand:- start:684 stop:1586 length:903 start_codon:yes stop_codon:yes gene_type:complete